MNFYAYRLPGAAETVTSASETLTEGIGVPGFAVCAFRKSDRKLHTIPEGTPFPLEEMNRMAFENMDADLDSFPCESTSREEHKREVNDIVNKIKCGLFRKAVAARAIIREIPLDLAATFRKLCDLHPDAFVFCFHSDISGTWIGATPERLISRHGDLIESMALAGTRPAGTGGCWDTKNIDEHNFVVFHIQTILAKAHITPAIDQARTLGAGPVEHLMTRISYRIPDDMPEERRADLDTRRLAVRLSPSPAVSGYPADVALNYLESAESFDRNLYGGFIGPVYQIDGPDTEADFFVNLRSMRVEPRRVCIYAGGGITIDSVAADEWDETERKASTLINALIGLNLNTNL